jgi:hypothetical protein
MSGSGQDAVTNVTIPLAAHSGAGIIRFQRNFGEILICTNLLYVDQDGDGLTAADEVMGNSDGDGN